MAFLAVGLRTTHTTPLSFLSQRNQPQPGIQPGSQEMLSRGLTPCSHTGPPLSQAPARPGCLQVTSPAPKPAALGVGEWIRPGVTREGLRAQRQGSSGGQHGAPASQLSRGGSDTKQHRARGSVGMCLVRGAGDAASHHTRGRTNNTTRSLIREGHPDAGSRACSATN